MDYNVVLWTFGVDLWRVEIDGVLLPTLISSKEEFFEKFGEWVFDV